MNECNKDWMENVWTELPVANKKMLMVGPTTCSNENAPRWRCGVDPLVMSVCMCDPCSQVDEDRPPMWEDIQKRVSQFLPSSEGKDFMGELDRAVRLADTCNPPA